MNVLVTGGTGFIGSRLISRLHQEQHHTYILTRTPKKQKNEAYTTYLSYTEDFSNLPRIDVVVNLAGESLFGYWTKEKKQKIIASRIDTTKRVHQIIQELQPKPKVFINGSAVGFYGTSEQMIFTEKTDKSGGDFLADVVTKWEEIAKKAEEDGIRTVFTRFGIVLGHGGSLPLIALPVKYMVGGKIGSGEQWISWIHIDDAIELILFAINQEHVRGALNLTAPHPIRHKEFMKILADILDRPYWLSTPGFLFQRLTGEMSQLILKGQYVLPQKALDNGFSFTYPNLKNALLDIYNHS